MLSSNDERGNHQKIWAITKEKIKHKWPRLSDTEIDSLEFNLQFLVERLQETYGNSKEYAKREYNAFRRVELPNISLTGSRLQSKYDHSSQAGL